jgi:hypothetical protein
MQTLKAEVSLAAEGPHSSLFIGIGGHEVEIPYDLYSFNEDGEDVKPAPAGEAGAYGEKRADAVDHLSAATAVAASHLKRKASSALPPVCVVTVPAFPELFVLGDVFLRSAVVVHNLTDASAPFVKIFPRTFSKQSAGNSAEAGHDKSAGGAGGNSAQTQGLSTVSRGHSNTPEVVATTQHVDSQNHPVITSLSMHRQLLPQKGYDKLLARGFHHYRPLPVSSGSVVRRTAKESVNYPPYASIDLRSDMRTYEASESEVAAAPLEAEKEEEEEEEGLVQMVSSVPLRDLMGIEYLVTIEVGHPLQANISVIVDTGSGALALG